MSESRAKKTRDEIGRGGTAPESKKVLCMRANCPLPKPLSKKRHEGEPLGDFEQRRKVCNERRRIREKQRGWRKRELSGT